MCFLALLVLKLHSWTNFRDGCFYAVILFIKTCGIMVLEVVNIRAQKCKSIIHNLPWPFFCQLWIKLLLVYTLRRWYFFIRRSLKNLSSLYYASPNIPNHTAHVLSWVLKYCACSTTPQSVCNLCWSSQNLRSTLCLRCYVRIIVARCTEKTWGMGGEKGTCFLPVTWSITWQLLQNHATLRGFLACFLK